MLAAATVLVLVESGKVRGPAFGSESFCSCLFGLASNIFGYRGLRVENFGLVETPYSSTH